MAGAPASVSEAKAAEKDTVLTVQGIVLGYAYNGTWTEIIIKDTEAEAFIGIRSTEKVNKGDLIKLNAKVTISDNPTEVGKKYLGEPEGIEVISSGNATTLDLTKAIAITNQDDLAKVHEGAEYVLYKLEGNMFGNMYEADKDFGKAHFRVNFVAGATKLAEIRFKNEADNDIAAGFRNNTIAKNLGEDWCTKVFGVTEYATGGYPGHAFSGTIYAMYIGGNKYYESFTIFELDHIIKAQ